MSQDDSYWYIRTPSDNPWYGPLSFEEVASMARAGQLQPADRLWTEGMDEWAPATQIPKIKALLKVRDSRAQSQTPPRGIQPSSGRARSPKKPVSPQVSYPAQPHSPKSPIPVRLTNEAIIDLRVAISWLQEVEEQLPAFEKAVAETRAEQAEGAAGAVELVGGFLFASEDVHVVDKTGRVLSEQDFAGERLFDALSQPSEVGTMEKQITQAANPFFQRIHLAMEKIGKAEDRDPHAAVDSATSAVVRAWALWLLARVHVIVQDLFAAKNAMSRSVTLNGDPRGYLLLACICKDLGLRDETEHALNEAISRDPDGEIAIEARKLQQLWEPDEYTPVELKSKVVAALLIPFFLGTALHRYYLGHYTSAIVMNIVSNLCCPPAGWLWSLIDLIHILNGTMRDSRGLLLTSKRDVIGRDKWWLIIPFSIHFLLVLVVLVAAIVSATIQPTKR